MVMADKLRIWCCPHFKDEVEAIVASSPLLSSAEITTYPFSCLQIGQNGRGKIDFSSNGSDYRDLIIGGGCLNKSIAKDLGLDLSGSLVPDQCFYLVTSKVLVDDYLAKGAYLLTPGWLKNWQKQIADWGFDQKTAREFFRETTKKLVLLETGVRDSSQTDLKDLARYLDLPSESIPVGLEMLKLSLEHLVLAQTRPREAVAPPDRFFADNLMLVDLLNDLLSAGREEEAVARVMELFHLLFAPGVLDYKPLFSGQPGEKAPLLDEFNWTGSGRGFEIALKHKNQVMGSLILDDLAFAQYKERYLALALPLSKVCALAIKKARDLEEQKKVQEAIRRMAGIVESSDDAIIGKTLEGVIVSWNQGARRIYGYEKQEVLGKHVSFLLPQDQPDEITRMLEKIRQGKSADPVETVWVSKEGRLSDVSLQVSPIRDEQGRVVGASSIARDITEEKQRALTERKSLEAQLLQAQKLESVGRLAGGIAHDFNNLLAVVLGYCELSLEDVPESDPTYYNLTQISQAAQRARRLTRQLLAFARKQVLSVTSVDLSEAVSEFIGMIKRLIGEDVKIELDLAGNLPQILADRAMIEQVLLNLAVNARDAMPKGGVLALSTSQVELDEGYSATKFAVVPGEYVMISVSDTGEGMDEETRQKIFEPFFSTKGPGQGTGLGLATVYGIVKQHGGNIWVYSEPGQGTVFKIYFPVTKIKGQVVSAPKEEDLPMVEGEVVLVVEDEKELRELICCVLTKQGYEVLCCEGPETALAAAAQYEDKIDLMLTDVVMPKMNGKELYDKLFVQRPGLLVVFMSGYTEDVIANQGILHNGINFLQKPFSTKELHRKLRVVLSA
ncbi:response regulator receiver [Dethiosulfatarculus sandiegensis]|uniref:histidine kinase n=2 Tax=Dethiosulfatarculus sandiegensis TaxID=1429043 RepID=A0A0D2GE13_9BACT|nr:response regulator receiver [Dethiosulfatarculus sandiegensis]